MLRRRHFQYQTLLRVRERQTDLHAMMLADAQRDLQVAERCRETLEAERKRMLERISQSTAPAKSVSASDVRRYYQYERHLAARITDTDALIAERRLIVEQRRAELEEAMKRQRILERLKERQTQEFQAAVYHQEQAISDEAATNYAAVVERRHPITVKGARPIPTGSGS